MRNYIMLAKGKDDRNRWVEGFYSLAYNGHTMHDVIITGTEKGCSIPIFVDAETVCQFTRKFDIHEHRIYNNDIVVFTHENKRLIGIVKWNDTEYGWYIYTNSGEFKLNQSDAKIIGNTIDNPEIVTENNL